MTKFLRRSIAALLAFALALWPITASATDDLWDYSDNTPANNINIGGVSYAENMLPGLVNDGVRMLISQIKRATADQGSDIASSATTEVCATGTSLYAKVTGTTAITSLGTAAAGCWRWITFTGILTLTHNASSLILPGGANITTAANDVMGAVSEGSGNWRVLVYTTASGGVVGGFSSLTATSTDAGAGAGPDIKGLRDSASPADNDLIGRFLFNGRDESSNEDIMASLDGQILDATGGTEDAEVEHKTRVAGTLATRLTVGQGLQIGAPTSGDMGLGTANADNGIYKDGVLISSGVIQKVTVTTVATDSTTTAIPADNTKPQNTEGEQVFSQSFTPRSAASTITIEVLLFVSHASSTIDAVAALFVDSGADAVAVGAAVTDGAHLAPVTLRYSVASGSTSARTYAVRYGAASGTVFLNRFSGGAIYGGVVTSSMTIEESL